VRPYLKKKKKKKITKKGWWNGSRGRLQVQIPVGQKKKVHRKFFCHEMNRSIYIIASYLIILLGIEFCVENYFITTFKTTFKSWMLLASNAIGKS
jgi:hypothetical protein